MNKLCLICGTEFVPKKFHSGRQIYCKSSCNKKAWKKRNWQKVLADQRAWFKKKRIEQPERFRMYVKNRKALIRLTGSSKKFSTIFRLEDWVEIQSRFNNKCVICDIGGKMTIDHIIPLSKGGLHCKENIQPLCHSCNSRKKDKINSVPYVRHTVHTKSALKTQVADRGSGAVLPV